MRALCVLFCCTPLQRVLGSEPITIKLAIGSVGQLLDYETRIRLGTGFVVAKGRYIVTASHVAISDTLIYSPATAEKTPQHHSVIIAKKATIPEIDLCLFEPIDTVLPSYLEIGDFCSLELGDPVIFLGSGSDSEFFAETNAVAFIGSFDTANYTVNYASFCQDSLRARPGFSGGPVLNSANQVVAQIIEGTVIPRVGKKNCRLQFSAYSLEYLAQLDSTVCLKAWIESLTSATIEPCSSKGDNSTP